MDRSLLVTARIKTRSSEWSEKALLFSAIELIERATSSYFFSLIGGVQGVIVS
jgi:hypothetical protein